MPVRYVLPGLVMVAVVVTFMSSDGANMGPRLSEFLVNLWLTLYLLACLWWTAAAVLDRRRQIWRLLLIWAPMAIPSAVVAWVVFSPSDDADGQAIAMLFYTLPTLLIGFCCLVASALALMWRPEPNTADSE